MQPVLHQWTCHLSVAPEMPLSISLKPLTTISGALKLLQLVSLQLLHLDLDTSLQALVLATFLLAYVGYDGDVPLLGPELDHLLLGYGSLLAWLLILPSTILGLLLGDGRAWRTVGRI